jgi:hypothetical protein
MKLTGRMKSIRYMRDAYRIFVGYLVKGRYLSEIAVENRKILKMSWKKDGVQF